MQVIAHRGASIEQPENTLAAFRRAIELQPLGIKLDVRLSKDGVAVLMHDSTVDRTTNGTGLVTEFTAEELHALDAGNGEPVPTFAEVLDLVGDQLHIFVEIKAAEALDAALAELDAHPQVQWSILSGYREVIDRVHTERPDVTILMNNPPTWEVTDPAEIIRLTRQGITDAQAIGAQILMVHDSATNAETVQLVKDAGLTFWVWTIDDADRIRAVRDLGVEILCTNAAADALAILAEA